MSVLSGRLVRFQAIEDGQVYFADVKEDETPRKGLKIQAYESLVSLKIARVARKLTVAKLLAPVPADNIPIYCVGVNYRNHAEEAGLAVPSAPVVWFKPAAALADPDTEIPMPKWCWDNFPDYEGELVFVTSKVAKDVSVADAKDFILGYTIGNDLTSRLHQDPKRGGGQFTYAKAFDKFAPLGPVLISPEIYESIPEKRIQVRVNGKVMQDSSLDFVWTPAEVLSHISQGTTVPAGTAVMTGTPGGVGWFQKPQAPLRDRDSVEVEVTGLGILRNTIKFVR